jgi:GNAT superfamily N-acetyltransferase
MEWEMVGVKLRASTPGDGWGCLELFDANATAFATEERTMFARFLQRLHVPRADLFYGVAVDEGNHLVGCGGIELLATHAKLRWGMVHPDYHRQGIGRWLVGKRLERVPSPVTLITCETSLLAAPLYRALAFAEKETIPNGFGPGMDTVVMERAIEAIREVINARS